MARLSGTDTMMLAAETKSWHFHVGGLTIIESAGDSHATLQRLAGEMEQRLALVPKLTWKLRTVPFGLDLPVWVQDEDFDIRRHVFFVTLPAPAGRREVAALAGRIMSKQLDRRYPLWELYLIDGLGDDRLAVLMKCHHSLMDGVSGASLTTVLFDTEPHPAHPATPTGREPEPGPTPSWPSLMVSAIPHLAQTPVRFARFGLGLARRALTVATASSEGDNLYRYLGAPRTSFNKTIGPRRAFGFSSVALADVRLVKNAFGVKVNDVVLALCAGALRNYLIGNGEHLSKPLVAGVPISSRGAESAMDNRVAIMFVKLATDVIDPVERLMRIRSSSQATKNLDHAVRSHPIPSMGDLTPPAITALAVRALADSHLATRFPTVANTTISNVPGPPFDLYCGGGRVAGIYSTSVIMETMGVNITLLSYGDRFDFGVIVDPDLVPDPFLIADGIPAALLELLASAGLGDPTPVVDPFGRLSTPSTDHRVADVPSTVTAP